MKAPAVAQSPVVQRLCVAEQGGRSLSHDIELLRGSRSPCTGKAAVHRALVVLFYLEKNNNEIIQNQRFLLRSERGTWD